MITPIIIPNTAPRDCILIAQGKYCKEEDVPPKFFGIIILLIVAFFIYFGLFLKASDRWKYSWIFFWLIPFVTVGVLLIIFG